MIGIEKKEKDGYIYTTLYLLLPIAEKPQVLARFKKKVEE